MNDLGLSWVLSFLVQVVNKLTQQQFASLEMHNAVLCARQGRPRGLAAGRALELANWQPAYANIHTCLTSEMQDDGDYGVTEQVLRGIRHSIALSSIAGLYMN